nr:MAG: hypothetical protein [Bacteriophage sp.]
MSPSANSVGAVSPINNVPLFPSIPCLLGAYETDVLPSENVKVVLVHRYSPPEVDGIVVVHPVLGGVVALVDLLYSTLVFVIPTPSFPF